MWKLTFALSFVVLSTLAASANAQTFRLGRVIATNANTRDLPSISGTPDQQIPEGTIIRILDQKLPWYVVRVGDRIGWMHGNTFEFLAPQQGIDQVPQQTTMIPETAPKGADPRQERSPARNPGSSGSYIRGPRGGCYYISGSGRKVYVDHSLCN